METYLRQLYYELAISTNPHAVASVLQLVGPERLLYGSDWPALDEADVQNLIQNLIQILGGNPLLQPDDRARIERHNAMELFPRLQPSAVVHCQSRISLRSRRVHRRHTMVMNNHTGKMTAG